jgi:hypothetical protein
MNAAIGFPQLWFKPPFYIKAPGGMRTIPKKFIVEKQFA